MREHTHTSPTGIKKVYSEITVDMIRDSFGRKRAQLRQHVKSIYPAVRPNNSLSSPLFAVEDFGQEGGGEYDSQRVAFVPVPDEVTEEDVKAQLAKLEEPTLVRYLDLKPILSAEQKQAMESGLSKVTDAQTGKERPMTIEDYAERQLVRDGSKEGLPEVPWTNAPDGNAYPQFGITVFKDHFEEDHDNRANTFREYQNAQRQSVAPQQVAQRKTAFIGQGI